MPQMTKLWIGAFGIYGEIISDWVLGGSVVWKGGRGNIRAKGKVTACELHSLLRFTIHDVNKPFAEPTSTTDGITYTLTEHDGHTTLTVLQGDFAKVPEYEKYYAPTDTAWDQALKIIKELAEY